jgi:putative FmdB family regulatory protein
MPFYDYQCGVCGPFRDFHPLSEWDKDAPCPNCGSLSKRSVTAPRLSCVSRNVRIAHERNERSAEEPRVMRRDELDAVHGRIARRSHKHGRNMYRASVFGHVH